MNLKTEQTLNEPQEPAQEQMSENDKSMSPAIFLRNILATPESIPPEGKIVEIYGVKITISRDDTVEKVIQEHKVPLAQAIAEKIGVNDRAVAFPQLLKDKVVSFIIDDDPASEKTYDGPNYLNAIRDLYPELFQA